MFFFNNRRTLLIIFLRVDFNIKNAIKMITVINCQNYYYRELSERFGICSFSTFGV